jgi:DNA-binding transcriptional ArsR family regulator
MEELILVLRALSDETRWRIVELLLKGDLCVGAIAQRIGISNAAVSQHLRVLREAGIVRGEKKGYWTHYTVNREVLREVAKRLELLSAQPPDLKGVCWGRNIGKERREEDMCKTCCIHPENLKGKPEECSPEQIKKCHGQSEVHPCEEKEEDSKE